MRKLAADEILELAKKLQRRELWANAKKVIAELYDESQVVGFDLSAHAEYNDQDYDQEGDLSVFGEDGDPLPYDFTKPFFQQFKISEDEKRQYLRTRDDWAFGYGSLYEALKNKRGEALSLDLDGTGSEGEMEDFNYRFYYLIEPKVPDIYVEV